MHIIIDGYNLIRQSDSLRRFEQHSLEKGRNELVRRLALHKKSKGHTITIVFDGWQEGGIMEERQREKGIDIIFSRQGEKADDVIKRLAHKARNDIVVVTSDREIAAAVQKKGKVVISSPEFAARLMMVEWDDDAAGGSQEEYDDIDSNSKKPGTKKKGPSRRMPKTKRIINRKLQKL